MKDELNHDYINKWVTAKKPELLARLHDMVVIPSENKAPHGNEKPMQEYLLKQLNELGFASELYELNTVEGLTDHPAYWPGRDYKDRPNLFAMRQGADKQQGKSLMFSVHADVVPGISGKIAADPFAPVVQDERVYGRGSNDMKGGTAAILMAFQFLKEHGIELQGDLMFESIVDEEMGGANGTLAGRLGQPQADAAIIPEPTNLRVCSSHLGGTTWRIQVKGKGGMGFGGEQIDNPIYGMSRIVLAIEKYEKEMNTQKKYRQSADVDASPVVILSIIQAGDFEPGMADGIPESCMIEVWVETLPEETLEDLENDFLGEIKKVVAAPELAPFEVQFERIIRFIHGSSADTELSDLLAGKVASLTGGAAETYCAPFACDGFMFNRYSSTPAVILGPVGENAHAADEFVSISSLLQLTQVYIEAILAWCGGHRE